MNKELNVNVGDIVLYHSTGWRNNLPVITKVVKITPTGRIKTEYSPSIQFDKYGRRMGGDAWSAGYLEIPTAEKLQGVKEKTFIRRLVQKLRNNVTEDNISYEQAVAIDEILKAGEE